MEVFLCGGIVYTVARVGRTGVPGLGVINS